MDPTAEPAPARHGALKNESNPLVTVLTPVYNGQKYLGECIESILKQTYRNFEYVIVNNCSSDETLDIARSYQKQDDRIRIHCNTEFVGCIENHNIAFSLLSEGSSFCKVVAADDQLFPTCIEKLVDVAQRYPSAGIVGSYQLREGRVMWQGVPKDAECITGRDACRMSLIDDASIFGPPTSALYRSDLVRQTSRFFPTNLPHGDISACFVWLQHSDYGFVHEVLSTERIHDGRVSATVEDLYIDAVAAVEYVVKYGPAYLTEPELTDLSAKAFDTYYRRLAGALLKLKSKRFWQFHTSSMRELGHPVSWSRVAGAVLREVAEESMNPRTAYRKLAGALRTRT